MTSTFSKVTFSIMTFVFIALLPGCWPFSNKEVVIEAEPKEQSLYVINVLDKNSFDDCHITGSINVPFDQVESFAKDLNRNTELVVYCANYMCTASEEAARMLKQMGFENVWAYEGGTAQWYQLGQQNNGKYTVEGACKASYLTAANEEPSQKENHSVATISAQELQAKMEAHGLLKKATQTAGE